MYVWYNTCFLDFARYSTAENILDFSSDTQMVAQIKNTMVFKVRQTLVKILAWPLISFLLLGT